MKFISFCFFVLYLNTLQKELVKSVFQKTSFNRRMILLYYVFEFLLQSFPIVVDSINKKCFCFERDSVIWEKILHRLLLVNSLTRTRNIKKNFKEDTFVGKLKLVK
jgi:hypothetical protein